MNIIIEGDKTTVVLSRRNLKSLLMKLDGYPPDSACTIVKADGAKLVVVSAQEDAAHYGERLPGEMHPATEVKL